MAFLEWGNTADHYQNRQPAWALVVEWVLEIWGTGTHNTVEKWVEGKLIKTFLNFLTYFCHISGFFKVERTKCAEEFWKIMKSGKKRKKGRKALFDLSSTHFLADSRYLKIGIRVPIPPLATRVSFYRLQVVNRYWSPM